MLGQRTQLITVYQSTVIGVCGRYIHTHQTMFSIADYEAAREMLLQALRGLDKSTVNTIVYGK